MSKRMNYDYKLPSPNSHDLAIHLIRKEPMRKKVLGLRFKEGLSDKEIVRCLGFTKGDYIFNPMNIEEAIQGVQYFFDGHKGDDKVPAYSGAIKKNKLPELTTHDLAFHILNREDLCNRIRKLYVKEKKTTRDIIRQLGFETEDYQTGNYSFGPISYKKARVALRFVLEGFGGNSLTSSYYGLLWPHEIRDQKEKNKIAIGKKGEDSLEGKMNREKGNSLGGTNRAIKLGLIPWTRTITVGGREISEIQYAYELSQDPINKDSRGYNKSLDIINKLNEINNHGNRKAGPEFTKALKRYEDRVSKQN